MSYLLDNREFLTPAEAQQLQIFRQSVRYTGMHPVCDSCWALEPYCRCNPTPEPSLRRRLLRRGDK